MAFLSYHIDLCMFGMPVNIEDPLEVFLDVYSLPVAGMLLRHL